MFFIADAPRLRQTSTLLSIMVGSEDFESTLAFEFERRRGAVLLSGRPETIA
jgi:hypothetical protein